jgi:hypothetical protein
MFLAVLHFAWRAVLWFGSPATMQFVFGVLFATPRGKWNWKLSNPGCELDTTSTSSVAPHES